jgi:large subunit ribosomal protein L24
MFGQPTHRKTVLETPKFRIRKGDTIRVIAGKEKGKVGKVLEVDTGRRRVYVEKVNIIKRHQKPSQKHRQGGIIEKEGPLHISKVMLVCQSCGKASRTGMKPVGDGEKTRYCKKCGEMIDRS